MSFKCEYCDSAVPDGTKVCPLCGAALKQPVQTPEKAKKTAQAQNTPAPAGEKPKKSKSQRALAFFLSLLFVAQLGVAAFRYPGFVRRGGGNGYEPAYDLPVRTVKERTWTEQQTGTAVMPAGGGSVSVCGVTVSSDPANISGEENVTVIDYGAQSDYGEEIHRYDVSLGEHRLFEVPVAVSFPCSLADDEDAAVVHYSEETGEWIPLAAEYDEQTGTVTAYFSSLSPTEVRKEKKASHADLFYRCYKENADGKRSSRYATIEISDYYWSILKRLVPEKLSDDALRFVADPSLYARDFEKYRDDYLRDKTTVFNEENAVWSEVSWQLDLFKELPTYFTGPGNVEELGEALGWVSLIMSAYQVLVDYENAGGSPGALQDPTLVSNAYKNFFQNSGTIFSKMTGYGSTGFTVAFVFVTIVALTLDKAVKDAQDAMYDRNADIFYAYFDTLAPFNRNEWYETFREAYYRSNNDPDRAMEILSAKIDQTVSGFWTDIYKEGNLDVLVAATEAETKNYFTKNNIYFYNVSEQQKKELNDQMKWEIWTQLKKEVMPLVNRFLVERMQDDAFSKLARFKYPFNEYLKFEISEQVLDMNKADSVCAYPGCSIYFGKNGKPVADWEPVRVPEDGQDGWALSYDCTVLGWCEAGQPDCLLIYESEEDMQHGNKPVRTVPFTAVLNDDRTTRIDVTVTDSSLPVWGLEKIVFCPEYSDESAYYKTNIEASETYFGISHICEYGCDFTITGMAPGKVVHTADEFRVGVGIDGGLGINCAYENFSATADEDALATATALNSFKTKDGRTSVTNGDTLYGEEAVSRYECREGQQLVLKLYDGEICYFYRAMPESEAMKIEPVIVRTERPAHIPSPVVFPAIDLQMTEWLTDGEPFYGYSKLYSEAGKTAGFKLGSNGDFTMAIPALDLYHKLKIDAITVTGNVLDGIFGKDCISCRKLTCSPRDIRYDHYITSWYTGNEDVTVRSATFTHTNPLYDPSLSGQEQEYDVSYIWIELRKNGKFNVRVVLEGEYRGANYDISDIEDTTLRLEFEGVLDEQTAADFTRACGIMNERTQ